MIFEVLGVLGTMQAQTPIVPQGAKGIDIREYGAIPNDGKDDTRAIQNALDDGRRDAQGKALYKDFFGRPKALYFPKGIYDVSDTIDWIGAAVTLDGDGPGQTVLRLKDKTRGFRNPALPKAVLKAPNGNMSFRQNIRNLRISTGKGNLGAIGIDYNSSNIGTMENVTITSKDRKGHTGLAMYDGLPGPLLVKNVRVNGFDTGIGIASSEYGIVLKDIQLSNQNQKGISVGGGMVTVHGLSSNNSVPAIESAQWFGMVTLVNGNFRGGASGASAIETKGQLYARNVRTQGYQSAIKQDDNVVSGSTIKEYSSKTRQLFGNSSRKSLNLPIKKIPEFNDTNLENWGRFNPRHYGDTAKLQALLNSGKSTIYFPSGTYFSYNQAVVEVPSTVKKIVGYASVVNGSAQGRGGGGIKFVLKENSQDPLIIEGFGYGITVDNRAARDVALKNGKYTYNDGPGVGDLYLEDVGLNQLNLNDTANVYAWQLNTESSRLSNTKIENSGANMVVFGIKTEGKGTIIKTTEGGNTEVLGGFILPIQKFTAREKQEPAFQSVDSGLSLSVRFRHYEDSSRMYDVLVEETRKGSTRRLKSSGSPHQFLPLYTGHQVEKSQANSSRLAASLGSPSETLLGDVFGIQGKLGQAISLTGSDDVITLENSKDINQGIHSTRSLSFWFKVDDASSERPQVIYEEGGMARGLNIYIQDNLLYFGGWNIPESQWSGSWLSTKKVSSGIWHHAALVLDSQETVKDKTFTAFLDGKQVGQAESSQLWQHTGGIGIGNVNGHTRFQTGMGTDRGYGFAGAIDELQIFNRPLNTNQIQRLATSSID